MELKEREAAEHMLPSGAVENIELKVEKLKWEFL